MLRTFPAVLRDEKNVVILLDEMQVREDLVYDKHCYIMQNLSMTNIQVCSYYHAELVYCTVDINFSGQIIGFTSLGEIDNHLAAYEKAVEEEEEKKESLANLCLCSWSRASSASYSSPMPSSFTCHSMSLQYKPQNGPYP